MEKDKNEAPVAPQGALPVNDAQKSSR